jgi:hypothetical protein
MKLARITTAIALATTLATPLVASADSWAFDDPYWKEQLSRRPATDVQSAAQYAQRSTGTMTDATAAPQDVRKPTDRAAQLVESVEAERHRLDDAGFPQYVP